MSLLLAVRQKRDELERGLRKHLGDGAAQSYEDYRYIVGRIQGMADLMQEIEGVISRTENDPLDDIEV